jgi:hypothetical protein
MPPGAYAAGKITEEERFDTIRHACPGSGACGGMYTANTMASAIEALGMSLPYSSSIPAEDPLKVDECRMVGRYGTAMLVREPSSTMYRGHGLSQRHQPVPDTWGNVCRVAWPASEGTLHNNQPKQTGGLGCWDGVVVTEG